MILCKWCNAVRPNDASACACSNIMTISERAAASLHIPERQFFDNVLSEIDNARKFYPSNENLFDCLMAYLKGFQLCNQERDATFYYSLIQLCAVATRFYVEGDPRFPKTLPNADDPLSELEEQLKGL